ncbi:Imm1 family immunity protein [Saccharopolyspora spinosa]|uniref:Immunity protein Imm1 of predicted polymorphic toxin system n=1 Tax=Saccharopolyspora spinosa TaxID=60894 RepID=A0A2N3XVB1_SACSN|nr:Imm1 family immunity protein [Saccharopolyspora spinosa]PKW14602.1 immunity protein Imm1 of predicted polymorphic toxin system [Saccharopolyspora spinosa]
MKLDVSVRVFSEGGHERHVVVEHVDQLPALVDQLAAEDTGSAIITHQARPRWNEQGFDHELVVAFGTDGRAALSYWDAETPRHYSRGSGLAVEGWEDENIVPPADAWVPRNLVESALEEFLRTAKRPTAVEWRPDPFPLPGL